MEETYYVTFDDNYLKRTQTNDSLLKEIFPKPSLATIPLSTLYDEFMLLFDEPENAISSESKAADNKVNELKKIIKDDANDMHKEPPSANDPHETKATFQGEF